MLLVCNGCSTIYAVGLSWCPNCGSTDFREQGADTTQPSATTPPAGETQAQAQPARGRGKANP